MESQPVDPVARRPSRRVRPITFLSLIAVVIIGGVGIGAFLYIQHQQDVQRQQELATGHWSVVATAPSGQPTPTVPTNAFVFKDDSGNLVLYYPPVNPPIPMTWQTFRDTQRGYQLAIPANWAQIAQSPTLPGARMACPPGADNQVDAPGAPQCVIYGWAPTFSVPSSSDPSVTDLRPITVSGSHGSLFTQSALGTSITAVLPDPQGGDVIITTFGDSDALMYAFAHMLPSVSFS